MNIHDVYGFFMARFRPRRMRRLIANVPEIAKPDTSIIDVGGSGDWWVMLGIRGPNILIVNLDDTMREETEKQGYRFEVVDARRLPYEDKAFDLAVSNSVIEHVGDFADQQRFVKEMLRCGKTIYLQTPNKWFFVEPHTIAVFIHWLPLSIYRKLVRWFSVWGWVNKPTQKQVDDLLATIRLLNRREMEQLFPGLPLQTETFLGMTKSFEIVYRPPR